MQFRDLMTMGLLQVMTQRVGEQGMVRIPVPVRVQRIKKEIGLLSLLQQI